MQEVFNMSYEDSLYDITRKISSLIEDGYRIDIVSHSTFDVGYSMRYNCIVVATKIK